MDGKEGKDHGEFDTVCAIAGRELVGGLQTVRESDPFIGCPGKKKMFASARRAFDEHLRPGTPLPDGELVLARRQSAPSIVQAALDVKSSQGGCRLAPRTPRESELISDPPCGKEVIPTRILMSYRWRECFP
jgi:hypothetical protein